MALDKLCDSAQLDSDLEDVADAIRAKSGGSSPLAFPAGFISEIGSIQTGGGGESFSTNVSVQQGSSISASKKAMDVDIPIGKSIYALVTDTGGVLSKPFGGLYFWNEDGTKDRQLSVTAGKAVGWITEKRMVAVSLYATDAQTIGTGDVTLDIVII